MREGKNICSLCNRSEVEFYQLKESIRAPNDLRFVGHTDLQAVLGKILNKKGKDRKATNEICQKCRDRLHGIYSFTHQYTEAAKIFHQMADVTVRMKKLKSFLMTDFMTELEVIAETDKDIDSLKYSSTVCDNSSVSGVVVKVEIDNNFEDPIEFNKVMNDLNIGLLEEKYSNTIDNRSVEQKKMDSMDSGDAEQITIQDEIIKEEWTMQEGDIFEANHDVLNKQTKFGYEMGNEPSHARVEFKCDQCNTKCKTSRGLRDHKMSHTGETFTCNQCGASFSTKGYLRKHRRVVHTDAVFSCDHCDATYKTKGALSVHKQKIKGILFNCDQCDAKYKTRGGLRDHKFSHTGVTFACNECDARFNNKKGLAQHLRVIHTDAVFSCDSCDATYKSKRALNTHKLKHSGISFNCDQCDAKYKSNESLKQHKMSHTGVIFACNQCNASFPNKRGLKYHLRRVHTHVVLFPCDHCDATYKSKQALNEHMQIINGISFNCDQCGRNFKRMRHLKCHKLSEHASTESV